MKFFLVMTLVQSPARAEERRLLVQASAVDAEEFRVFVQANPALISWSEWWVQHRLPVQSEKDFEKKLLLAQTEFLNGGLVEAQRRFKDFLGLSLEQDWRSRERTAFAYAALRLAQLSNDLEQKNAWIKNAVRWGEVQLEQQYFPPPLWALYQQQLNLRILEQLDLDLWFPYAQYLLVDGRPLEIRAGIKWPLDQERHRFTLVFDHAPAVTRLGTWSELRAWTPALLPFAQGSCDTPQFANEVPAQAVIYFAANCLKKKEVPRLPSLNSNQNAPLDLAQARGMRSVSTPSASNWWLWASGALLTILVLSNQKRETSAPQDTAVGF